MKRESAVSFSEAVASAKKRKRKRRRVKPAMALTDAVRRFFHYQKNFPGRHVGVFCFSGRACFYREGCEKFRLYAKTAPGALVGIYNRHVKIAELVGDFEGFFSDRAEK